MYEKGMGVPKSDAEAVNWYRKAAAEGFALGQLGLGLMYGKGQGVPKDDAEAAKWFHKAAEQGEPQAQFLLGIMYEQGIGVLKHDAESLKWYLKAASQGHAGAQNALMRLKQLQAVWPLIRIAPPLLMIFDPWKNRDLRVSRTTI